MFSPNFLSKKKIDLDIFERRSSSSAALHPRLPSSILLAWISTFGAGYLLKLCGRLKKFGMYRSTKNSLLQWFRRRFPKTPRKTLWQRVNERICRTMRIEQSMRNFARTNVPANCVTSVSRFQSYKKKGQKMISIDHMVRVTVGLFAKSTRHIRHHPSSTTGYIITATTSAFFLRSAFLVGRESEASEINISLSKNLSVCRKTISRTAHQILERFFFSSSSEWSQI